MLTDEGSQENPVMKGPGQTNTDTARKPDLYYSSGTTVRAQLFDILHLHGPWQ